jgi:hypothetical protein
MILKVHLDGTASYDVGDEIWQDPLADAIHAEAETIAGYAGDHGDADLRPRGDRAHEPSPRARDHPLNSGAAQHRARLLQRRRCAGRGPLLSISRWSREESTPDAPTPSDAQRLCLCLPRCLRR